MKYLLSILCIYVCLTIGSMEKLKSDIKDTVKSKEIDFKTETIATKETLDTKETLEKKKALDTQDATDTKKKIQIKGDLKSKENVEPKDDKETKGKVETKVTKYKTENVETKENKDKKKTESKPKYYRRKTFATKEDIPKDYLDFLKEYYNIVEDPVGDNERKKAEYDYDYDNTYDNDLYYDRYLDESDNEDEVKDIEKELMETDKVIETYGDTNETKKGCKVCKVREADRNLRLATIKSMILDKLGFSMSNLPNMTGKTIPKIPSFQRLIQQQLQDMQADAPYSNDDDYSQEDEYFGQVKRAYTIAQKPPDDFGIHVPGGSYFELPESVTSRKVKDASLWIYLQPSAFERRKIVQIHIYVVPQKAKPQHILTGGQRYKKSSKSGWIEIKFAHIVHHWIKKPAENKGLVIQALDEYGNNHIVTPGKHSDNTYIPMLEMSTVEHRDGHHRKKRSINHVCTEQERIETCCRYPLRVDFVQFGWDWVIAPTGYMANYCSGECRYRHMENNPQAYIIQQTPEGSGPCCTPDKFYPLAMLYFDHAHTVLYTYMQKMIVERCGCA